jgi:hypothetical protein
VLGWVVSSVLESGRVVSLALLFVAEVSGW